MNTEEKKEFKTKSERHQEEFHNYLTNKLKIDGYSQTESELFLKFEDYINQRFSNIDTTVSMIANGIALQKDTGISKLRDIPQDETFTIQFETMDKTVSRDEYVAFIREKSSEAVTRGVPVLDKSYDYLFKQAPSLNRVLQSSGEYTVTLLAMLLQHNQKYNHLELVCLFETYTGDIFSYRFRKNQQYDIFSPNYTSTFEIKSVDNVDQIFSLFVAPSRTSGLLRITNMKLVPNTFTSPMSPMDQVMTGE